MANDKLVNREVLKAAREKFQQKIENATIVAGQARTIAAVSEESGTMQDAAFINQGTGTNNNTSPVDTSPVGKNIQKEGYSIVYNQWNNSSYTNQGLSVSGQHITLNKDTAPTNISHTTFQLPNPIPAGHKILEIYVKKSGVLTGNCNISGYHLETSNTSWATYEELTTMANGTHYKITTLTKSYTDVWAFFYGGYTITENLDLYYYVIDLTQWFNGKIPSDLSNDASHFSWYYNGDLSYNVGQIKDCNGRYLECGQGRQVWDEQWEAGIFDTITGENTSGTGIRSKNLIRVIPNVDYYGWCGSSGGFWIMFLDKDENVIPLTDSIGTVTNNVVSIREDVIKTPANAIYAKFYISSEYGSTYKHDITISLFYESGDSYYGHYYPYVAPVTYDTGNKVLRSIPVAAGDDIKDIELPSNAITRNIGTVDMGTLTWTKGGGGSNPIVFYATISNMKLDYINHLLCGKYIVGSQNWQLMADKCIIANNVYPIVYVKDSAYDSGDATAFKTAMSGVTLYYELATPTMETGTAFIDNIQINDYSYMAWKNTDNEYVDIPQGVKIFYPADYVLDMDTLHTYTDGDMTKIVLKGELSSGDPDTLKGSVDLTNSLYDIMQQNIGGTLRQQLADKASIDFNNTAWVDLGSLNWQVASTATSGIYMMKASVSGMKSFASNTLPNVKCTIYKTITGDNAYTKTAGVGADGAVVAIYDANYNQSSSASSFKKAMKGILIAYEKA